MKKLMTMIAAVATSFGLFAATADTGTSFEGASKVDVTGKLVDKLDLLVGLPSTAVGSEDGFWTIPPAASNDTTIVALGDDYYEGNRPNQFKKESEEFADNKFALNLKTSTNEVKRFINSFNSGLKHDVATAGTLFFDSTVKLTGFDETPVIDNDAKLAVWLTAIDADAATSTAGETNLWVSINGKKYDCGPRPALLDQWARVTIKAMKITADGKIGFVVFVDESAVASVDTIDYTDYALTDTAKVYSGAKQLFPLANGTTVESMGFAGVGLVDDLVFTQTVPGDFAKDTDFFTIAPGDNVASFKVADSNYTAAAKFIVNNEELAVEITYEDTYFGDDTTNITGEANQTYTVGNAKKIGATFNGKPYADTASALAAVADVAAPTSCKLVVFEDAANIASCTVAANENVTELEIDLNGSTITVTGEESTLTFNVPVKIVDNGDPADGKIIGSVYQAAGSLTITAGTFDGNVSCNTRGSAASLVIGEGSKFLFSANNEEGACTLPVPSDEYKFELVDEDKYWTLVPAPKIFTVEVPAANANSSLLVTIDEAEVGTTNGTYTVANESTLKAVYMADEDNGYEFAGGQQSEFTINCDTEDKTITAPTATLKTFTVTYMVGDEKDSEETVNWGATPVKVPTPTAKPGYTGAWDKDPAAAVIKADETFTYTYTEIAVTEITLDKSSVTIYVGGTSNVVATIAPAEALVQTVEWDYSALDGFATAQVEGNTIKITGTVAQPVSSSPMVIKAKVGAVEATCNVFVEEVPSAGPTTDTPGAEVHEQEIAGGKVAVVTTTDSNVKAVTLSGLGATTTVQVNGQIDSISGVGADNNIIVKSRGSTEYDITEFCTITREGGTATIALDPAKATPVIGEVTVDDKPVAPVSADGTVGFATKLGLYYKLIAGDEPGAVTVSATESTLATGATMKLTADPAKFTPTGAKAFFKVEAAK